MDHNLHLFPWKPPNMMVTERKVCLMSDWCRINACGSVEKEKRMKFVAGGCVTERRMVVWWRGSIGRVEGNGGGVWGGREAGIQRDKWVGGLQWESDGEGGGRSVETCQFDSSRRASGSSSPPPTISEKQREQRGTAQFKVPTPNPRSCGKMSTLIDFLNEIHLPCFTGGNRSNTEGSNTSFYKKQCKNSYTPFSHTTTTTWISYIKQILPTFHWSVFHWWWWGVVFYFSFVTTNRCPVSSDSIILVWYKMLTSFLLLIPHNRALTWPLMVSFFSCGLFFFFRGLHSASV